VIASQVMNSEKYCSLVLLGKISLDVNVDIATSLCLDEEFLFVDIGTNAAPSGLGQPAVVKRHPKKLIGNRFKRKICINYLI
jgi:hypothetical protein